MADNVVADPGAGGATFATDEEVGVGHHPYTKLVWGPNDTFNRVEDTSGKRLPVKVSEMPAITGTVSVFGTVVVDGSGVTQPVSAASLPLPTGAATEATLATRLSESDFDTKTGSLTEAPPGTDTASSGLNGRLQRIAQRISSLIALLPAALVGGRLDVNIGASPATVPVSAVALPLPSGAATEATLASVDAAVADVATETTLATRASEATLATRLSEADFDTKTGSLTEAAPGTDTASSGLNGRLQRIAQRITSLIALLPAALVGGRLDVNLGASPTTLTVQDTASKVDDAAFTPATDRVLMVGAEADEGSPDLVDEGDAGALRMTLARALHVNIRDDAGDSAMDGANNAVRVNIVAGAGSGGAAQADRSTFTDGTTQANPIAGVLNDTPTDPTEDQAAAVRITAKRALHVNQRAADGSELAVAEPL